MGSLSCHCHYLNCEWSRDLFFCKRIQKPPTKVIVLTGHLRNVHEGQTQVLRSYNCFITNLVIGRKCCDLHSCSCAMSCLSTNVIVVTIFKLPVIASRQEKSQRRHLLVNYAHPMNNQKEPVSFSCAHSNLKQCFSEEKKNRSLRPCCELLRNLIQINDVECVYYIQQKSSFCLRVIINNRKCTGNFLYFSAKSKWVSYYVSMANNFGSITRTF